MINFNIVEFLRREIASSRTGRVYLNGQGVSWCLDAVDGQLKFASHSLQYLSSLETVLPVVGCESALPVYWRLIRSEPYRYPSKEVTVGHLSWTSQIVDALVKYDALNGEQAEAVLAQLTEDALDSLLGLDAATITWETVPSELWHLKVQGLPIEARLEQLTEKAKRWQPLSTLIYSPHQRPYSESSADLRQPVPQGRLSPQMLGALARMMQGASLRQIAQTVKQDEITLATLLYPYIQRRVIKLWPPVAPLDRLPWLPGAKLPALSSVVTEEHPTVATENGLSRPKPLTTSAESLTAPRRQSAHQYQASVVGRRVAKDERETQSLVVKPSGAGGLSSSRSVNPSSKSEQSRYLIICIDDSQAMLEQIDSYLDPERFELKTVIDPVASVAKFCVEKPDLVLMDVSMPGVNGNTLCEILKRSFVFKSVPIIMISGNVSPLNLAMAKSAGANDYLAKPFSKAQLLKVLETYLSPAIPFT